jgi:trehalose 6-phosphate phosphatase
MTDLVPPPLAHLPPPDRAALLLDMDGTLLDIAPRPDLVVVPPGLAEALSALRLRLGDALAIITGRPVAQIDALLPGIPYAVAGEHGGALRPAPGAAPERPDLPRAPDTWRDAAAALAARVPGAMVEEKSRGFVMHYRACPDQGPALHAALAAILADDPTFVIAAAHMAWEIRPLGADKGTAVRALLDRPPFRGRLPIFIGDDVTDEDGIAAAQALGGAGLRVPEVFGSAGGVRAWLMRAAETGSW